VQGETFVWTYPRFFYHCDSFKKMMLWFFIVIIAILAYLYFKGASDKKNVGTNSPAGDLVYTKDPVDDEQHSIEPNEKEKEEVKESFSAMLDTFEMIDYQNPKLRANKSTLSGTNKIVVWNSARVNTLRERFDVQNVLQRLEFHNEANKVIEVYRAVNKTGLDTYVFPIEGDDELVVRLDGYKPSDDPSETASTNKIPMDRMNVFLSDESMIAPELVPMIRELETSYKARQSSSGPKAVDTHRS
jgi:hypothetical protein